MKKKIILIVIVIIVVLGFVIYQFFIKKEKPEFVLEKVVNGTVLKTVSETGMVKISEEIKLGFKNAGRIEKILVKVGDVVEAGKELAKIETNQFYIELAEYQAALEVAQADYNKLLAGSSPEEIKVAGAEVANTQAAFNKAEQNLGDVKLSAEEDLKQTYQNALNVLDEAYLKIYNAYNTAYNIQQTYFTVSDQEGIKVREKKDIIKNALDQADFYISQAKNSSQNEKTDAALKEIKSFLSETKNALEVIRNMTEEPLYRNVVSSSDKTSLDNQKSYINTAYSNIVTVQQNISTTKIANQTNINSSQSEVAIAEAKLEKAKDELALKKAGPRQEDIDLYQAKIKQAQAKVSLLQSQLREAVLKSPNKGQITKINKREGEMVQPTDWVVSSLPKGNFQIEVDIYEEDIVDVKIGDPVEIFIPAFPDENLKGLVVSVNPAEKMVSEVVYYETTIDLMDLKEGIKPGMTADIVIETNKKENVLVVSKKAVNKVNNKKIVKVFKEGKIEEREIEIGLEGDDSVEIISGLEEGEEVIVSGK